MTAIWSNDSSGWKLLAPVGFSQEAALHDLVEQAPQMLPLAGSPRLTVVGREVSLGGGYADLIAVEPDGRLAVIEVKLARNAEARRAIVSQVLAYAAYLHGQEPGALERDLLSRYLSAHGHQTLAEAVAAGDQEHSFDPVEFANGLAASLAEGRFRLVFVLDDAPDELVRLVGYLEAVTDKVLIDLVTVSAYEVGGSQILVPQRVEPERRATERQLRPTAPSSGYLSPGSDEFKAASEDAPADERPLLKRLLAWTAELESAGLARLSTRLSTYNGQKTAQLRPLLLSENAALATLYLYGGRVNVELWRRAFERHAPEALAAVGQLTRVGDGTYVPRDKLDDALLEKLTAAYREAAGRPASTKARP